MKIIAVVEANMHSDPSDERTLTNLDRQRKQGWLINSFAAVFMWGASRDIPPPPKKKKNGCEGD